MAELLDLLQWPAWLVSVTAAWLIASSHETKRHVGFWLFLLSNVLWAAWGISTQAWALVALQLCLAAMNIRGVTKTDAPS
jgi:hypothetical protein